MAPPPPSDLKFNMGDIERKVHMSLDDIIKMSKQKQQRRAPIKNRTRVLSVQQRKDALQRSVALRSSAVRQGKLAEARARGGNSKFVATKAAARRALSLNVGPTRKWWNRKSMQGASRPFVATGSSLKISVPNRLSKKGTIRRPAVRWMSGKSAITAPRRSTRGPNKMTVNASGRTPQTLDSRFANLRERQLHSGYGSLATWRR